MNVWKEIKKIDKEYNYFNAFATPENSESGNLAGLYISVKDSICVKGLETRAGSAILNGYKPVFDATVVSRLKKEGAIVIGKTSQDEFGFGSFNVNVGKGFKIPLNPIDKNRVTGGSSGGSAGLSKIAKFRHVSLGESTGGSIACPSAYCGVFGLTPTYGRVSRNGLLEYGSSLDKIGPISNSIEDIALVMEVISGRDNADSTTSNVKMDKYSKSINTDIKGMKLGLIESTSDQEVEIAINKKLDDLEKMGAKIGKIKLPTTLKYGVTAYYLLAMAEASTNLALFCGMRYGVQDKLDGNFNDYFSKIRSENFGDETKRRIIIGTFVRMAGFRDAYYIKAARLRTQIINEYKKGFKKFDCLVSPSMPNIAPKFSDLEKLTPIEHYMADQLTVGPNLAGLPHLSIPLDTKSKMPAGMLLIGDHFQEKKILRAGSA